MDWLVEVAVFPKMPLPAEPNVEAALPPPPKFEPKGDELPNVAEPPKTEAVDPVVAVPNSPVVAV